MKLCDTCIYRNNVEQLKPCIIYRDDCEYYEKERGDMTREEAIHKMEYSKRAYQMLIDEKVQEGVLVGQGINAEWSADTPIIDAYKDMLEACDMAIKALEQEPKTGHCKDCKYFEYDSVAKVDGVPLIVAHEICNRWGDGCKTREDGYCFLFEPQESEDKE